MDPKLYDAAAKGDVEPFKNRQGIETMVTVTNNTILHVNIIAQDPRTISSTKFAEEILRLCPSLLLKVNNRGDTPLHIAAKCGLANIVRVLIERAKSPPYDPERGISCCQMIEMLNNEKNTALHEAVYCDSMEIVMILVKEMPEFRYSANSYGETPLYIAATKKSFHMVDEILKKCPSAALEGPFGKTALHAAAINSRFQDLTKPIVERDESLIKHRDQYGWTPLHYAAYFDCFASTEVLLEFDGSAANIVNVDRKMTPLHLAAAQGHGKIVDLIISYCPECCELVDDRGWNVLHFAMVSFNGQQLKNLLKKPFIRNLINEKDVNGNTPLHVLAAFCRYETDSYHISTLHIGGTYAVDQLLDYGSPELKQEIQELSKDDNSGQYPKGFIKITEDKWKNERTLWEALDEEIFGAKEAAGSQLVVDALIATVTFAAGFTLPGGYRSEKGPNQGTAILSRKSAFQAFVITDAIAMVLSITAVFIHVIMSLKAFKESIILFFCALCFTLVATIAMVVAFVTGTYAMLSPTLGLAIPTCFIGLSFFLFIFCLLYKAGFFHFIFYLLCLPLLIVLMFVSDYVRCGNDRTSLFVSIFVSNYLPYHNYRLRYLLDYIS